MLLGGLGARRDEARESATARVWAAAVEDGGGGPDGAMGDRCPGSCETRVMAHGCLGRENQQQEKARAGQEVEAGDVNTQYEQVSQAAIARIGTSLEGLGRRPGGAVRANPSPAQPGSAKTGVICRVRASAGHVMAVGPTGPDFRPHLSGRGPVLGAEDGSPAQVVWCEGGSEHV